MNIVNHTTLVTINQEGLKILIKECLKEELDKAIIRPDPTKFLDGYLTTKEVLDLLKISKPTIIAWRKKGLIHAEAIGKKIFYRKDELENLLSGNRGNLRRDRHLKNALLHGEI